MVRVSVCMASYNGSQFIQKQLESILDQLSIIDEVIISDDGSTDNTIQIIESINDKRIKLYLNKGNHGPISNFENALNHSSGNYIFFADQDDIWLPSKVVETCLLLENYHLVLSNCEVINKYGDLIEPSFFKYRGSRQGFFINLYRNSYMGCCMAFRREILHYILPFPLKVHMHDWWIGLLVELKGRVVFCEQPLIQYVRHGNNFSPTGEKGYNIIKRFVNRFIILFNVINRILNR